MNRRSRPAISLLLCGLVLQSGCRPMQPFYFNEDGDLSHYVGVATELDYPDIDEQTPDDILATRPPMTIDNFQDYAFYDISLEEVTRIALENSDVIRTMGGRITDGGQGIATAVPNIISNNPNAAVTTYDASLVESGNGTATGSPFSGTGVEAALAEFDAQLDSSIIWQKNDRPQNFGGFGAAIFATDLSQDLANGTIGVTKTSADGTTWEFRHNTNYESNNNFGSRVQLSDWVTNFEAGFTHPLLQGRGTQINRIAGPQTFQQSAGGLPNSIDGVIIARIREDVTLADFKQAVRDQMREIEQAYWELYFAYRDLESRKVGLNSSLETWRVSNANLAVGRGSAGDEAQTRTQVFQFQAQLETALTQLLRAEANLRYQMGLPATDGRLIRPMDEPTGAAVHFDWAAILPEALVRRSELQQQKWNVKRRELELIASRNQMLPRLDAVGRYRWLGAGDDWLNSGGTGVPPFGDGSNAFEVLTTGDYQEWELGFQLSMPLGFRNALAGIRHFQTLLARERAVLRTLESEISHQLSHGVRDIDHNYRLTATNLNRRAASEDEVAAIQVLYDVGTTRIDVLLQSQQRRADAESAYYRSLVDYNIAIMNVHFYKGSLLEYNGVYLAEGPWPNKAYFDALNRARRRDASWELNYGFTRPDVISRGPNPPFEAIPGQFVEPLPLGAPAVQPEPAAVDHGPDAEMIPAPLDSSAGVVAPQSFAATVNSQPRVVQPEGLKPLHRQATANNSGYTQATGAVGPQSAAPGYGVAIPTTPLGSAASPAGASTVHSPNPSAISSTSPSKSPEHAPANPFRSPTTDPGLLDGGSATSTTLTDEPQPDQPSAAASATPPIR